MLNVVLWNPDPVIFHIGGFSLMWYGVLFALGLVLAGWYVWCRFRQFGISQNIFENLIIWSFFGIFIGARLCHCLFYEPGYFLSHPVEMLLPVAVDDDGRYFFSGYHGLASHGGGVGLIFALLLFRAVYKVEILPVMDFIAISTPLAGAFIRFGNLMNSEIIGRTSDLPWAFVFESVDMLPRHPAQLYEALFYLALFVALALLFKRISYERVSRGFYLSVVMMAVPAFRFLIEFTKEVQVGFEEDMFFNMGQLLSLPIFVAGLVLLVITQWHNVGNNKIA